MKKQRAKAFGDKREFIMQQPCAVANEDCKYAFYTDPCGWWSDPAHLSHSQGAGGTSDDLVPLCHHHHNEQHAVGIQTFAKKYGLDLDALAAHYEDLYQREIA